jgi:hypothetical protein
LGIGIRGWTMSCIGKGCVEILGKGDIKCSGFAAGIEQTTSSQPSAVIVAPRLPEEMQTHLREQAEFC